MGLLSWWAVGWGHCRWDWPGPFRP